MKRITYTIELEPLHPEGFAVRVPSLPGCVTWALGMDHAVEMAREAIEVWIRCLQELGEPIPVERKNRQPVKIGVQVRMPKRA